MNNIEEFKEWLKEIDAPELEFSLSLIEAYEEERKLSKLILI